MKRFLILSILIAFATVSCAGANKAGWTKRDFRSDKFEKDREECIQTLNNNLDSYSQTSGVVDDLEKEGYEFKKAEEPPSGNKVTAKDIGLIAIFIVLSPLILAYGVLLVGSAP